MNTRYHFIRHGESEANLQTDTICGRSSETPLSTLGHEQARLLGEYCLKEGLHFDAIYTSTAQRAISTTEEMTGALGRAISDIVHLEHIEEKDQGKWTGLSRSETYTAEMLQQMQASDGYFTPPEGESDRQAGERLYRTLLDIVIPETHGMRDVAIVSHGNVIRCMIQYSLAMPFTVMNSIANTGIVTLEYNPQDILPEREYFTLLRYNATDHLLQEKS